MVHPSKYNLNTKYLFPELDKQNQRKFIRKEQKNNFLACKTLHFKENILTIISKFIINFFFFNLQ